MSYTKLNNPNLSESDSDRFIHSYVRFRISRAVRRGYAFRIHALALIKSMCYINPYKNMITKKAIGQNNFLKLPKTGEIVEGEVIGNGKACVFLDLGNMGAGIIYGKEFYEAKEKLKSLKTGSKLFAKIVDLENEDGYIELSLTKANEEIVWSTLKEKKGKEEIFPVKISGANKGGLLAEVSGIPAFLPASQLSPSNYPKVENGDNQKILQALQKFVGKELNVKIFDLDEREGKLILSEKAKENEKIKEILKNYKVGDIVEGEITGVVGFGAFIKFPLPSEALAKESSSLSASAEATADEKASEGEALSTEDETPAEESPALEGLIHISELDWQLIEDPTEIIKVGEKVKAKIIEISNNKVSLSLKALKQDPWQDIEKKYKKGDTVKGKATKFNPFGVFVQISEKIQGLCHISEFGSRKKMEESLEIGKDYDFQILSIEPKEHRMSLKLIK